MSTSNGVAVLGTMASEVEVVAKATRRRFSAEYKLKILRAAEACTEPGAIGALLRPHYKESYSSNGNLLLISETLRLGHCHRHYQGERNKKEGYS